MNTIAIAKSHANKISASTFNNSQLLYARLFLRANIGWYTSTISNKYKQV